MQVCGQITAGRNMLRKLNEIIEVSQLVYYNGGTGGVTSFATS